MKVLITGASGFLGAYVTTALLKAGHHVQAMIRPQTNITRFPWHQHSNIVFVACDLTSGEGLAASLKDIDAVVHLAATKGGTFEERFAGTVTGTQNLLLALQEAAIKHLVVTSTFSVYDYQAIPIGAVLDENSPIEDEPQHRDTYAQTKLMQEAIVREFAQETGSTVTIIRPGMIYGRESLWHALLGVKLGKNRWLVVGGNHTMPMTYVENCAEAIVQALTSAKAFGQTINIVDDYLPTQQAYTDGLLSHAAEQPQLSRVSWNLMQSVAQIAWLIRQIPLRGKVRLPGILVPAQLQARFKPLQYSNQRAKDLLDWTPRYSFEASLTRSYSSFNLLNVEATDSVVS